MIRRYIASMALVFVAFVFLLFPSDTLAGDEQAPSGPPDGRVSMTFGRGSFILTVGGGHGVLTYNGVSYKFKIVEAGVGGIGGAKIIASGSVYNLKNIDDFSGAYGELSAGFAIANKGKGTMWLKNTHGVVLKLNARAKGMELTAGGQGLVITLMKKK